MGSLVLLGIFLRQPQFRSSAQTESPRPPHSLIRAGPPPDAADHRVYLPLVRSHGPITEARALWVTRWNYSTESDVESLIDKASAAGFNMIFFQVRGTADAFYTPGLEPWAARLTGELGKDPGCDPLQTAIETAHTRDLELHAYINVYPVWLGQTPPPTDTTPQHLFWTLSYSYTWDDWRMVNSEGVTMTLRDGYLWPSPAIDEVEERVVAVASDLLNRYDIDGIHLDLVRYPGPDYSYDGFTEAALATSELSRPDWQRHRVTQLVQRIYTQLNLLRPEGRLSAAVWPVYRDRWGWQGYTQGHSDFYQDSQGWTRMEVIDAILPMIYPTNVISSPDRYTQTQFSLLVQDFLANSGNRHVLPGISAQYDDFDEIAQRIAIARQLGAPGHAIFSAGVLDDKGYWDDLATGPYAVDAVVPPMPWRAVERD